MIIIIIIMDLLGVQFAFVKTYCLLRCLNGKYVFWTLQGLTSLYFTLLDSPQILGCRFWWRFASGAQTSRLQEREDCLHFGWVQHFGVKLPGKNEHSFGKWRGKNIVDWMLFYCEENRTRCPFEWGLCSKIIISRVSTRSCHLNGHTFIYKLRRTNHFLRLNR